MWNLINRIDLDLFLYLFIQFGHFDVPDFKAYRREDDL